MVERKLFKTQLCVLYRRGHCPRQNCNFAHGNAELRQYTASRYGRRGYRGGDLRHKLDKRLSPEREYSPGRDARGRHSFHGSSPSRSLEKSNDRKRRKKHHFDDQSDFSGSLKISDRAEDQDTGRKNLSSELKVMQSNVNKLEHRKSELMILLEEKVKEADSLTANIQELEAQLSKEKEECKKINSNVKKFVKAYKHYALIQDELKRSEVRFHKLGDQLVSGISAADCNEENSNINIVSDGETNSHHAITMRNEIEKQNSSYPSKKSSSGKWDTAEESTQANLINNRGYQAETTRPGRLSHLHAHPPQLNSNKELEVVDNRIGRHWPLGHEGKQKKGKSVSAGIPSLDKLKGSGSVLQAPSTSMAAHAVDKLVEIEMEENVDVVENVSTGADNGAATYGVRRTQFLLPPPPPIHRNTYSKCQGEDDNVDIDGMEEMADVDIV